MPLKTNRGGKRQSSNSNNISNSSNSSAVLGKQGKAKTVDEALANTNPNYGKGREYGVNCQRCVQAYELQRRGYDVEALAATMTNNDPMFQNNNWMRGFMGQTWTGRGELGSRTSTVEKSIRDKMNTWGDGSRAIVYVAWKAGSAHVFNVENHKGSITISEAQTGKRHSLSEYISIAKPSYTMISRVDNLAVNEAVMKHAVKPRGGK